MNEINVNAAVVSTCMEALFPIRHQFADRFYARLFHQMPQVRELFVHDPRRQNTMLFSVISMVLKGMDAGRNMTVEMAEFGRLHAKAGVREEQFPVFGAVFLETLIEFLPDMDHPRIAKAWWGVYTDVYEAIIEGMKAERALQATDRRVFRANSGQLLN